MQTHDNKTNYVHPHAVNFHHRAQGNTTKFWLLPDGHCYDTDGMMHFRWAQAQKTFLRKHYGVRMSLKELQSDDEQSVRVHLICEGMIRINHCRRQNTLTVEGCKNSFTESALDFIRRLVVANGDDICFVTVNIFNGDASQYSTRQINLVGKRKADERQLAWQAVMEPDKPLKAAETRVRPANGAIILHIPHASTAIPSPWRGQYVLDDVKLDEELKKLTDWFTDELFFDPKGHYPKITFPYSRLLVDVERFADDALEPMAACGMGVFYTKTTDGCALREKPAGEQASALMQLYHGHQAMVAHSVEAALARYGKAVIIDCHSFPENALPCHDYASPSDIAFCVGTDPEHTPKWLSDWLLKALESPLGKVTLNTPFSGAFVPSRYYGKDKHVYSVMIEVNRGLYMNEETGTKSERFELVRKHLQVVMREMADYLKAKGENLKAKGGGLAMRAMANCG
jgi:N-formylglutamate deformylase